MSYISSKSGSTLVTLSTSMLPAKRLVDNHLLCLNQKLGHVDTLPILPVNRKFQSKQFMKKKTYPLIIRMLKSSIKNEINIIKDIQNCKSIEVDFGNGFSGKLFYRQNHFRAPGWVEIFEPVVAEDFSLYNSSTAAVLILQVESRYFALTFGYGVYMLHPDCYEENFGLRVVLNSVDPEKIRSLDKQSLEAVPVNTRSQASVATNLSDFGIDIERVLVYAATGLSKDSTLGKQISGKDALKISIPVALNDIPELLKKLSLLYESDAYKDNFAWIDHLSEVRDNELITSLDSTLADKINGRSFERTWLAALDILEWSNISGFKYHKKKGSVLDDISWESYLDFIGTAETLTPESLRKQTVFAINTSSEKPSHSWSLYRCILCELSLDGTDYALNNGKWFRVSSDFLQELNESIKIIPRSTLELPDYAHANEKAYNAAIHDADPEYFALCDANLISHGGGRSKIEFCDIFTKDNHLMHVKRYGGSSVLSHLFAQGMVSARLLLSDSGFRQKVNLTLPETHQLENASQKPNPNDFEVVYVIASNKSENPPELPLFSKIALRNSIRELQIYGMRASIKFVQVKNGTTK